jgi:hypothetical protein
LAFAASICDMHMLCLVNQVLCMLCYDSCCVRCISILASSTYRFIHVEDDSVLKPSKIEENLALRNAAKRLSVVVGAVELLL